MDEGREWVVCMLRPVSSMIRKDESLLEALLRMDASSRVVRSD
jgi:hypothetical protein